MPEDGADSSLTLALNTKLEEDFVSPLTAIRGALEILRDYPDLAADERANFVSTALAGCTRLERGVEELADTVYEAGQLTHAEAATDTAAPADNGYAARIKMLRHLDAIEVDFSDFVFSSSKVVNEFYDVLDRLIESSGRQWYVVVNYRDCSVWPEAWVAFAHRGKKVNVSYSLGTVRYVESEDGAAGGDTDDPLMFDSRARALAYIEELRAKR